MIFGCAYSKLEKSKQIQTVLFRVISIVEIVIKFRKCFILFCCRCLFFCFYAKCYYLTGNCCVYRKVVRRASLSDRHNLCRKEYETEAIVWRGGREEEDEKEKESDQENIQVVHVSLQVIHLLFLFTIFLELDKPMISCTSHHNFKHSISEFILCVPAHNLPDTYDLT